MPSWAVDDMRSNAVIMVACVAGLLSGCTGSENVALDARPADVDRAATHAVQAATVPNVGAESSGAASHAAVAAQERDPDGPAASAGSKRDASPQRTDSPVTTTPPDVAAGRPQWTASRLVTIEAASTPTTASFFLAFGAASLRVETWPEAGYRLDVVLTASAPDEANAINAVLSLDVDVAAPSTGSHLAFEAELVRNAMRWRTPVGSFNGPLTAPSTGVDVVLVVPERAVDVRVDGSGEVRVDGLLGRLQANARTLTVQAAILGEADVVATDATVRATQVQRASILAQTVGLDQVEADVLSVQAQQLAVAGVKVQRLDAIVDAARGDAAIGTLDLRGDDGTVDLRLSNPWGGQYRVIADEGNVRLTLQRTPGDSVDALARSQAGPVDVRISDGQRVAEPANLAYLFADHERTREFVPLRAVHLVAETFAGPITVTDEA